MKKIIKFSKIFLLIAVIFSELAMPVTVLADEIDNSMVLNMQLQAVDEDNDSYVDKYELTYISEKKDYDELKTYDIEIDTTFTYNDGNTETNTVLIEDVTGEVLNNQRSSYELDAMSQYYDGTYDVNVTVYDNETIVYENSELSKENNLNNYSTLKGLNGKLSGELVTLETVIIEEDTTGNYNVTKEGVYTQSLNVLTGELSPNGSYRIVYGENTSEVMTGDELRNNAISGTVTDLTSKLAGIYSYTDIVTIEEVTLTEDNEYEVVNTYTYTYDAKITYGNDNDELFTNMYGVTFEDGYIFVNAKMEEPDTIITLEELSNVLEGTETTLEVLDEEGNILDMTNEEVLSGEVKNNYTIKFTNGATASYKVIVKGDTNLDNILDKEDLSGVMEGYLNDENMPSMDMVTLEEEVTVEGQEQPEIVKEEFGTITFEDVMFTNEVLKETSNTDKEKIDNNNLTLIFGQVVSEDDEIYVGSTFELDVIVNSDDALDYIDGVDALVTTSNNLKLIDIKFNEEFTGIHNEEGRVVASGTELNSGTVVMTLEFTVIGDGTGTISLTGNTAKYLNIDEFEEITKEVEIIRRSSNNNLSSLNASVGIFDISFDKDVTVYTLTVPYDTESVILSGGLEDILSSVDGLIEYELTENNTVAIINVTAEDGSVKTYTVYIIKEEAPVTTKPVTYYYSSNNYLKSLEVEGYELEFDKNTNEYKITVKNDVTSLDIRALAEHSGARVEITGNEGFEEGENTVIVTVTAENGSIREYKIIVNKEGKKEVVTDIKNSSNTAEKIVIIILIILVVLGLLYLIFKKDDEEEIVPEVKKETPKKSKTHNTNKNSNNNKTNNSNNKKK